MSTPEDEATPALRAYKIRRALGPDPRRELSQRAMAELLNAKAAELGIDVRYDSSVVARIETGQRKQTLTLDDVEIYAALDPLERGREWLGWGRCPAQARLASGTPATQRSITDDVIERRPPTSPGEVATKPDGGPRRRSGGRGA